MEGLPFLGRYSNRHRWNDVGNKLIAVAQDFPEDKYDFKVQQDERTLALNLLHAAAIDFVLIRRVGNGVRKRAVAKFGRKKSTRKQGEALPGAGL
jgi:hypothetical protein